MNRHVIIPPTGLLPHRPYSPAVLVDRLLFVSGHTGSDPVTRAFSDDVTEQTELALRNIRSVVEAAGKVAALVVRVSQIGMTAAASDFGVAAAIILERSYDLVVDLRIEFQRL